MRILITNSVPLNGGDEALLRATIALLRDQFPECSVKVLCKDVDFCKRYYSDLDLDSDLEYVRSTRTIANRLVLKARLVLCELLGTSLVRWVSIVIANKDERRIVGHYKSADLIISSAGGFLHDYYGVRHRLIGFKVGMAFGRPVVIVGQSIGPFGDRRTKRRAGKVLSRLDAILLREGRSFSHLEDCGVDMSKVLVTADIAFYWRRMASHLFVVKQGPLRTIALSFREWKHDGVSTDAIVEKAAELCAYLLGTDASIELLFISTCQGIPGYVDDSVVASSVVKALPEALQARCRIDGNRYAPDRLIWLYSQVDAYIGMRLHGAIMAMLGGTPAMAIAYEEKTPGIYAGMGLEAYQVDHRESVSQWIACAETFIGCIDDIRIRLSTLLDVAAQKIEINKRVLADVARKRSKQ